ncbi:uncharacterized protein LOC118409987 isoform X1 [Branchiostoma floridae]|uniref:Uncharacterized protein LOC118409987 isoform X1 n=1 Tax=Branchiostoma floridae TaxID=7739 RepID=A0A9J7MHL0_BRAFL|nr:uncharacterized protein LOC118409987 isoform X1 [Branchiostoma floridae]
MPPRKKARKAARPEAGDDPSPTERGDQPSPEDAPPQPTRKAPDKPKLTMKFLQKQLEDLQQVTTQIANKLNSTNSSDPQTPGALPTDGGSAGLVGLNTSPSSVTVTHVTDTPGVLPIATTSGALDPQPPSLPSINPNAQMPGLGSTLASSILGRAVPQEIPTHGNSSGQGASPSPAQQLNRLVDNLLVQSLAPSTISAYRLAWQHFRQFSLEIHCTANIKPPIPEPIVCQFISYLHSKGFAPASIASKLSAIGFIHKIQNLQDPTSTFVVRKLMHSIQKNHVPDGRLPITPPILSQLIDALKFIKTTYYNQCLYEAMFTFMFYSLARISEVTVTNSSQHTLTLADLRGNLDSNSGLTSFLVQFKTYKHSSPSAQSTIQIQPHPDSPHCPVVSLAKYLQLRGRNPGYLFQRRDGCPVTSDNFAKALRACVLQVKLDPQKYTSHSFRIGAATQAALQGVSDSNLRLLGRWTSDAFKKYIRT